MSELISDDKIKARHFYETKRFIDDLGILYDRGRGVACGGMWGGVTPPPVLGRWSVKRDIGR